MRARDLRRSALFFSRSPFCAENIKQWKNRICKILNIFLPFTPPSSPTANIPCCKTYQRKVWQYMKIRVVCMIPGKENNECLDRSKSWILLIYSMIIWRRLKVLNGRGRKKHLDSRNRRRSFLVCSNNINSASLSFFCFLFFCLFFLGGGFAPQLRAGFDARRHT